MISSEKKYWLGFSAFPGIGPLRFKLLKKYFGSVKKAWEASEADLIKIKLGEKLTAKFCHFRRNFSLEKYVEDLDKKSIQVITLEDKDYPSLLAEIPDAPFLIYVRGDISVLNDPPAGGQLRIAVVGTRKITNYGREVTRRLVEELVDAGLVIVSGMAYGVDTVAHETAVAGNGRTIAVLGCGVDIIYPRSNTTLYWQIIKKYGAVISEFPLGMITDKGLFPSRNRIISGLSLGVVVTEGAEDSGALITARYAAQQGREVFAVPGPITSEYSKGPTILLKQGAKLVAEVKDILEELNIKNMQISKYTNKQMKSVGEFTKEEIKILEILKNENLHFDEVVRRSKLPAAKVGSILSLMEMKEIILNQAGVYGLRII